MKNSTANKVRISITIMPILNKALDDLSEQTDQSKSSLIESAVEHYLKARLEHEAKQLSQIKFDDLPSEDDWLILQT